MPARTVGDGQRAQRDSHLSKHRLVDLDGTLAEWTGTIDVIGAPLQPMVDRVKAWLARGEDVRIFTSRVSRETLDDARAAQQWRAVTKWCEYQFGTALPVTCSKDLDTLELWDDRAIPVVPNKGHNLTLGEAIWAAMHGNVGLIAQWCLSVKGEFWECGVYQGEMAAGLLDLVRPRKRTLRLFDTFCGRPDGTAEDAPQITAFGPRCRFTDVQFNDEYRARLQGASFHVGLIPETFQGLEASEIAFAYIDLDLYQGTKDALAFILPRLMPGGVVVVHDYLTDEWPGVRKAVHECGASFRVAGNVALFGMEPPEKP